MAGNIQHHFMPRSSFTTTIPRKGTVPHIEWPNGKRFAFSIFDDTDGTTIENGPPLYGLLYDLGMLTSKSVWPLRGEETPRIGGMTCKDASYLQWILQLAQKGFEIAIHNATYHSSKREQTLLGLEEFRIHFGKFPNAHSNHAECAENLYWGDARLTGMRREVYRLLTRLATPVAYEGHVESSEYFWGDKCRETIKYVRNFVFPEINTLRACPWMPYHDPDRAYVNYWFASSEGPTCRAFCRTISEKNQDLLEQEGGACIMYTHLGAADFLQKNTVNPKFAGLLDRLSKKAGWFVPVSTLLDYILEKRGPLTITPRQRGKLETQWLIHKVLAGGTS